MENISGSCERCKKRDEEEKKPLFNRLSRIEGQLRGIRKMLEEDAYCIDVMMQVSAASNALLAISRELLKTHIRTCVVKDLADGKVETAEELAETVERLLKR